MGSDSHQKKTIEERIKSAQRSLSLMQRSKFADDYQIQKQKAKMMMNSNMLKKWLTKKKR